MKVHPLELFYESDWKDKIELPQVLKKLKTIRDSAETLLLIDGLSLSEALWLARAVRLGLYFIGPVALAPIAIIPSKERVEVSIEDLLGELPSEPADVSLAPEMRVLTITPQIYIVGSAEEAELLVPKVRPLSSADFEEFMRLVKLEGQIGSHAISNEWAAFTLGRLLGVSKADIPGTRDLVYLCYLLLSAMKPEERAKLCTGELPGTADVPNMNKVDAKYGNILLIDDQDDVWYPVIRKLVEGNSLTVWGRNQIARREGDIWLDGKNPAKWEVEIYKKFDLVLLDMRLEAEEISSPGNQLSGLTVLEKIMSYNRGQQVIMFTSSNKAWNIKRALELGARDIFIKESPQYPITEKARAEELKNLEENIKSALELNWLKRLWSMGKSASAEARIRAKAHNVEQLKKALYNDIATQVDCSLELFINAGSDSTKIKLAYLQLYIVLELLKNYFRLDKWEHLRDKFGLSDTEYLYRSLNIFRLMRNDAAHSEVKGERRYVNYKEGGRWKNGWKLDKMTEITKPIDNASDPRAFRALMYTVCELIHTDMIS